MLVFNILSHQATAIVTEALLITVAGPLPARSISRGGLSAFKCTGSLATYANAKIGQRPLG